MNAGFPARPRSIETPGDNLTRLFSVSRRCAADVLTELKSLTREELEVPIQTWEQPFYRDHALLEWLYPPRPPGRDTNCEKSRAQLAEK